LSPNTLLPRWLAVLVLLLLCVPPVGSVAQSNATPVPAATPVAAGPSPGAAGIGDPYFPLLGNGGYDALHYTIDLELDVEAGSLLDALTTIDAVATQDLSAFNFDFRGPEIDAVTVDGALAAWAREGGELTITPDEPIRNGQIFQVVVAYRGTPDGGQSRFERGWWVDGDSVFTVGQPAGADVWYPVNGHPLDKATYTLEITVSEPYDVVANGRLASVTRTTGAGDTPATISYLWENDDPTASYLVLVHAAALDVSREEGPGGITIIRAFPEEMDEARLLVFDLVPEMLVEFEELFGPYPFASFGSTVFADSSFDAALETQGIAGYDASAISERTVAHELAHQWFGDSVSLERWRDMWLNEGFARYAETLWAEAAHGAAADTSVRQQIASFANAVSGAGPAGAAIGDPGPDRLFSEIVYAGGALLLHDLRGEIGDDAFFTLLREWAARHAHGHATTEDFIALAEEVSGQELDAFFADWLEMPWTIERVAERFSLRGTPTG
jgi:aminopeptidase N